MNRLSRRWAGVLVLATAVAACPPSDQRTETVDPETAGRGLTPAAQAQLDSGNAAFREGDHDAALAHYLRVVEMAPDDPTGWFGVYMAYDATDDTAGADSALARARDLAPGASLLREPSGGSP